MPNGCSPESSAWSPDSRRILFTYCGKMYMINADGSHLHSLTTSDTEPRWSPDGQQIVFTSGPDLGVMRAAGSGHHLITHAPNPNWVNNQPDW